VSDVKARPVIDTPWLTAEEAAAYAKVSIRTIENWTSDGKVRYSNAIGRPRYRKSWLDEVYEKHVVEPVGASK